MGGIKEWLKFLCALVATSLTDFIVFLILNGIINAIEEAKIIETDTNFALIKFIILFLLVIASLIGYIKLFDSVVFKD